AAGGRGLDHEQARPRVAGGVRRVLGDVGDAQHGPAGVVDAERRDRAEGLAVGGERGQVAGAVVLDHAPGGFRVTYLARRHGGHRRRPCAVVVPHTSATRQAASEARAASSASSPAPPTSSGWLTTTTPSAWSRLARSPSEDSRASS